MDCFGTLGSIDHRLLPSVNQTNPQAPHHSHRNARIGSQQGVSGAAASHSPSFRPFLRLRRCLPCAFHPRHLLLASPPDARHSTTHRHSPLLDNNEQRAAPSSSSCSCYASSSPDRGDGRLRKSLVSRQLESDDDEAPVVPSCLLASDVACGNTFTVERERNEARNRTSSFVRREKPAKQPRSTSERCTLP